MDPTLKISLGPVNFKCIENESRHSKAKGKFRLPVLLLVVFAAEQRLLNMHGCALTSPVISFTKTGKGD